MRGIRRRKLRCILRMPAQKLEAIRTQIVSSLRLVGPEAGCALFPETMLKVTRI